MTPQIGLGPFIRANPGKGLLIVAAIVVGLLNTLLGGVVALAFVAVAIAGPTPAPEPAAAVASVEPSSTEPSTSRATLAPRPTPRRTVSLAPTTAPAPLPDVTETVTAAPPPPAPETWIVTNVVDGDTLDVERAGVTERIRVLGVDTPERGDCGFDEATNALAFVAGGKEVTLGVEGRDDRDRYDRLIAYVDVVGGPDAGLSLIEQGLAIARYDSRDGYGSHPREAAYVAADSASAQSAACAAPPPPAPAPAPVAPAPAPEPPAPAPAPPAPPSDVYYENCDAVRAAGAAPIRVGDPGYASHLDRDGDGQGCGAD